ncbi:MAG: hypothetical protein KIS66_09180 [Fimbriimonadaceae bacterium]|nr:hypothetical protein [Fimbriimonadaceae bacterium]
MIAPSPGRIVVLNGAPRSGKSSIVSAMQAMPGETWTNLGVDRLMESLPPRLRPGIGLRPGGERPDLEPTVVALYLATYESIAAYARRGLDVVADFGHHDDYSRPRGILPQCSRLLAGLPAWLVGVRCPVNTILERRRLTGYPADDDPASDVMVRILAWEREVHRPGAYDLEVDTSRLPPDECAARILERIERGPSPTAFATLARTPDLG